MNKSNEELIFYLICFLPLTNKTDIWKFIGIVLGSIEIPSFPSLTLKVPKLKIVEFANRVEPDEEAHNEPSQSHLIWVCTVCPQVSELSKCYIV